MPSLDHGCHDRGECASHGWTPFAPDDPMYRAARGGRGRCQSAPTRWHSAPTTFIRRPPRASRGAAPGGIRGAPGERGHPLRAGPEQYPVPACLGDPTDPGQVVRAGFRKFPLEVGEVPGKAVEQQGGAQLHGLPRPLRQRQSPGTVPRTPPRKTAPLTHRGRVRRGTPRSSCDHRPHPAPAAGRGAAGGAVRRLRCGRLGPRCRPRAARPATDTGVARRRARAHPAAHPRRAPTGSGPRPGSGDPRGAAACAGGAGGRAAHLGVGGGPDRARRRGRRLPGRAGSAGAAVWAAGVAAHVRPPGPPALHRPPSPPPPPGPPGPSGCGGPARVWTACGGN